MQEEAGSIAEIVKFLNTPYAWLQYSEWLSWLTVIALLVISVIFYKRKQTKYLAASAVGYGVVVLGIIYGQVFGYFLPEDAGLATLKFHHNFSSLIRILGMAAGAGLFLIDTIDFTQSQ